MLYAFAKKAAFFGNTCNYAQPKKCFAGALGEQLSCGAKLFHP